MPAVRFAVLLGFSSCVTVSQPVRETWPRASREREPIIHESSHLPNSVLPVFWFSDHDECPNWNAALHIARLAAGCYGAKLENRCQDVLRQCRACDICLILQPDEGPSASVVSGFPDRERRAETEPPGLANLWTGWRARFRKVECSDPEMLEILAGDMIEEAAHACPSVGGGRIFDDDNPFQPRPPLGCSGEEIQNKCMGRS